MAHCEWGKKREEHESLAEVIDQYIDLELQYKHELGHETSEGCWGLSWFLPWLVYNLWSQREIMLSHQIWTILVVISLSFWEGLITKLFYNLSEFRTDWTTKKSANTTGFWQIGVTHCVQCRSQLQSLFLSSVSSRWQQLQLKNIWEQTGRQNHPELISHQASSASGSKNVRFK